MDVAREQRYLIFGEDNLTFRFAYLAPQAADTLVLIVLVNF